MEPSNYVNGDTPAGVPTYIDFPCLEHGVIGEDGKPALNRWSSTITKGICEPATCEHPLLITCARP